jgi:chromate reductase
MTSSPTPVRVVGFSGSLRKGSLNSALLRAAIELAPPGMSIETVDIATLPFYDTDLVPAPGQWPAPVQAVRNRIAAADALLFVSPEYNYSIPACLKNMLDWASRPPMPPLDGKPASVMGATTGAYGTVRMQLHLRHVAVFTNMFMLNKPEVLVAKAADKFDADLKLTDEPTRDVVKQHLAALAAWTRRLRAEKAD